MIEYIFLTGFLGAGKTTLLNAVLEKYKEKRIGLIVNDFGETGVDSSLIDASHAEGEIIELKAGQIFCSCLSGSFIQSVISYRDLKPDLLIVECSGLAKPSALRDIVMAIDMNSPGNFSYGGMICLVDGQRHLQLVQSLMVLTEQMAASDLLVLSKLDLITAEEQQGLREHLREVCPEKPTVVLSNGESDSDLLQELQHSHDAYLAIDPARYSGWGEAGRPTTFIISPEGKTAAQLRELFLPFLNRLYRVKGVVQSVDMGAVYLDGTSAGVEVKPWSQEQEQDRGVVIITHDKELQSELEECFNS